MKSSDQTICTFSIWVCWILQGYQRRIADFHLSGQWHSEKTNWANCFSHSYIPLQNGDILGDTEGCIYWSLYKLYLELCLVFKYPYVQFAHDECPIFAFLAARFCTAITQGTRRELGRLPVRVVSFKLSQSCKTSFSDSDTAQSEILVIRKAAYLSVHATWKLTIIFVKADGQRNDVFVVS